MTRAHLLLLTAVAACGTYDPDTHEPGTISLIVTSPEPGAELTAADAPTIHVAGTVTSTDPEAALEAWVNGQLIEVADDGTFEADVEPTVGVNHVDIEAGDLFELVAQPRDVLWAPGYLVPLEGTSGFDVSSAIELRLGQRFFDGRLLGSALDLSTDPVVAHDLASVLELVLWHVDLAALIDGSIQVGSGDAALDLSIGGATPANIVADTKIVDLPGPAIELQLDLLGVFLATEGTFQFGDRTLLIQGGISADMHATARLTLGRADDGTVTVTVEDATAEVGPLVPAFTGPDGDELNGFITIGASDFRALVEGLIGEQLIPTFTERLPPLLESLLGAVNDVLDDVTFTLDPGLGTAVTLSLAGQIGALEVVPGAPVGSAPGHVTVHHDLAIRTTGTPTHPDARGAPQIDADPIAPAGTTSGVGLSLRMDFLNALLHALWNDGMLDGTTEFSSLAATIHARLPPVIRPAPITDACTIDGVRCDIRLELGQLEVELPDFAQSFGINIGAGARLVVDGATVSVAIEDAPDVIVWETSAVPGRLSPDAVRDLVVTVVWPQLAGAITDRLALEIPVPDLAALGLDQLAPGLAGAMLDLDVRSRPTTTGGYLGLGADLSLATPPPPSLP